MTRKRRIGELDRCAAAVRAARLRNSLLTSPRIEAFTSFGGIMATTIPARVASNGEASASAASIARLVPSACFGAARATQRVAFRFIGAGARSSAAVANVALNVPPMRRPVAFVEASVQGLAAYGDEQRRADTVQAQSLLSRAEGALAVVMRHAVDLLPIEAIIARVDVNALVGSVDLNALLERVDMDALLARLDLPTLINNVLSEIELGDLIQESTSSIVTDARDGVRVQAYKADDLLARVVDRILLRRRPRELTVPNFAAGSTA
jgi:hypothetical protein